MSQESKIIVDPTDGLVGRYELLPKRIGDVEATELLDIANAIINDDPNRSTPPRQLVAASALTEAALVYPDTNQNLLDWRLGLIDQANALYQNCAQIEYGYLERGYRHSNDQEAWLRANLQVQFAAVYKDIICGYVSDDTKHETIEYLHHLQTYLVRLLRISGAHEGRQTFGFTGEVAHLLGVWSKAQGHDSAMIPSSKRGGSGQYRADETHDLALLEFDSTGQITSVETHEIKSGKQKKKLAEHLARYTSSRLINIDPHTNAILSNHPATKPAA